MSHQSKGPAGWSRLFQQLTLPPASVVDPEVRREHQLLAVVLLVFVVTALLGIVVEHQLFGVLDVGLSVAVAGSLTAYALCRSGRKGLAAPLAIVCCSLPSYTNSISRAEPGAASNALLWLAVPIMASSLVLRPVGTVVTALGNLLGIYLLTRIAPHLTMQEAGPTFSLLLTLGAMAMGISAVQSRHKRWIRQQLTERARAESELQLAKESLESRVRERTADLRQATDRLQALIASSPAAVLMVDQQGEVALWNPAAERIFGWRQEEVIGRKCPVSMVWEHGDTAEPFPWEEDREVYVDVELRAQTKSGKSIQVSLSTAPLGDPGERELGMMALLLDVSDRLRLTEQLWHARKMEAVGQLAGGVAHDFNNLLTVINGNTELMLYGLGKGKDPRPKLERIQEAGQRAAALTQQLLAFSRRQVLQPQVLDINEVITNMEPMLRSLLSEDIELSIELGADAGIVEADPTQFDQVVMNLVVNAKDAMSEGGRITIKTDQALHGLPGAPGMTLSPVPCARLAISDTGSGMPKEIKEHIFEPFFTTKAVGRGTGLGLATVHGIVAQSGGDIMVESELGQGTTFRLHFPQSGRRTFKDHEIPKRDSIPAGQETILLAEDEPAVRALAAEALRQAGYMVLEAKDGRAALELADATSGEIHLVLSDVVMPRMSGPTLVEQLQKRRYGLRAVFMSGHADRGLDRHGAVTSGVPLVQKPFKVSELTRVIRAELDRAS